MTDARAWIDALPRELAGQASLLHRLLDAVEPDPRWEWLELGCSVAAGRGDALSDLDIGLGHTGDDPPPRDEVTAMLRGLGDVVDLSAQPWDGLPRWWVQYADGTQLDLVALPAGSTSGLPPDTVALLDRSSRLTGTFRPRAWSASPDDPRNWLLDGWEALANVDKYLRRGSLLEALDQVHRARGRALQLWAVGEGVPYPAFGLTSLLDVTPARLPSGLAETYATVDAAAVRSAALALAELLARAAEHAVSGLDTPLRAYVTGRLARRSDDADGTPPRVARAVHSQAVPADVRTVGIRPATGIDDRG